MTTDDRDLAQLRDVLDSSFGAGPPLPTPSDRLTAGRRALRRRRGAGTLGGAAAVVAVVAASFTVLGGGAAPRGADPMAPGPTATAPATGDVDEAQLQAELDRLAAEAQVRERHAEQVRQQRLVSNQFPAALDQDGTLVVKDGWRVTQQVEEPVGYAPPEASLGVVVTDGDRTRWMLLTVNRALDERGEPIDGKLATSANADDAGKGYSRFEDWLASMIAINGGHQSSPLVTVSADDQVHPGPGSTLVEVQEIDVIEGYTSPGDRVAEVQRDGRTWFAVIRGHGRDAEVIPVDGAVLPHATLAALLTYVGQQMESGEGVR
jgi:hypothetical protein